ncbi:40S ribosomal protein S15-4 [Zea mays]|uniref:40S ribosomal protein S15-4 n=1 Tax=Zea mays TaxID=4577 RepID=A0A1D6F931_MAIZE|nr:40S ribosomal protein S15-4 [Zea mays]
MADVDVEPEVAAGAPKKRTFRKYSYRGVDLDALLDMSTDDLVQLFPARARRRFQRGLKRKPMALIKKLRKAVSFQPLSFHYHFLLACSDQDKCVDRYAVMIYPYDMSMLAAVPSVLCQVDAVNARLCLSVIICGSLFSYTCYSISSRAISHCPEQKKDAPAGEKPEPVKTHLRNMIIVPEMIGSIVGVYNGKTFNQVEIKPEMIGHYLAEFSISYKPVKHGRPGIGATHSSRFIPLK